MRADRLIAALLVLQTRGRTTARALAEELEISERTARRDLEALAMSGVPVYSQPGRNGGWQLIGGATTDLTGLTSDETRSLFLALSRGASSAGLEDQRLLADALRKLSAALPEPFRKQASMASGAIKVDNTGWGHVGAPEAAPFAEQLAAAIIDQRQIRLTYGAPDRPETTRIAHPLGLVTKRGSWYLIADTDAGQRTFRLTRMKAVETVDAPSRRPDDFDLDAAWEQINVSYGESTAWIEAAIAVERSLVQHLRWQFGRQCTWGASETIDGVDWQHVTVRATNEAGMAAGLAGFGAGVRLVDAPEGVRDGLRRIASELATAHLSRTSATGL